MGTVFAEWSHLSIQLRKATCIFYCRELINFSFKNNNNLQSNKVTFEDLRMLKDILRKAVKGLTACKNFKEEKCTCTQAQSYLLFLAIFLYFLSQIYIFYALELSTMTNPKHHHATWARQSYVLVSTVVTVLEKKRCAGISVPLSLHCHCISSAPLVS